MNFFTLLELTGKENLQFTGQPGDLFLNSKNKYKKFKFKHEILNSEQKQRL